MRRGESRARCPWPHSTDGWPKLPRTSSAATACMLTLELLRTKRNLLFWTLHAAGWAAYGVTQYFGAYLREARQLRAGDRRLRRWRASSCRSRCARLPAALGTAATRDDPRVSCRPAMSTALALRIVINLSYKAIRRAGLAVARLFELFGGALSTHLPAAVLEQRSTSASRFTRLSIAAGGGHVKAVALAQEAQLKMLRYQLNPHFLFNTLNAISTLILDNQNRLANHAVTRLSEFCAIPSTRIR